MISLNNLKSKMNEFRYNACLMDSRNDVTYKYTPQPQNKTNSCLLMKIMSTTIEASFPPIIINKSVYLHLHKMEIKAINLNVSDLI